MRVILCLNLFSNLTKTHTFFLVEERAFKVIIFEVWVWITVDYDDALQQLMMLKNKYFTFGMLKENIMKTGESQIHSNMKIELKLIKRIGWSAAGSWKKNPINSWFRWLRFTSKYHCRCSRSIALEPKPLHKSMWSSIGLLRLVKGANLLNQIPISIPPPPPTFHCSFSYGSIVIFPLICNFQEKELFRQYIYIFQHKISSFSQPCFQLKPPVCNRAPCLYYNARTHIDAHTYTHSNNKYIHTYTPLTVFIIPFQLELNVNLTRFS